jgi:GNAT superfamily N-acetyltransferase
MHPDRDMVGMAFEAHPVTKERWPDLAELFDQPVVRTCFCMFYRKTGTGTGVGLENRKAMKALVDRGTVPGLIGYEDGVPVAWVSLGPREDYAKLRRSPIMKPVDDRPVWSIVCFFVDRRARGRGLSDRMLRAAVDYARSRGARIVEAYPVDRAGRSDPDVMFFGAKAMYDRAGFREVARRKPARPVVRKVVRPGSSE